MQLALASPGWLRLFDFQHYYNAVAGLCPAVGLDQDNDMEAP